MRVISKIVVVLAIAVLATIGLVNGALDLIGRAALFEHPSQTLSLVERGANWLFSTPWWVAALLVVVGAIVAFRPAGTASDAPNVERPDISLKDAAGHIANRSKIDLTTYGYVIPGGTGKISDIGARHIAAIRLINEAASAKRLRLHGQRQVVGGPSYEQHVRPVPDNYWDRAELDWWNTLDEEGWPQTRPVGKQVDLFLSYKNLRLSKATMLKLWPRRSLLRRWFGRRRKSDPNPVDYERARHQPK